MTDAREEAAIRSGALQRFEFRTLIALTMLLIASLGAGVAGWAAIKQQSSTGLERRLAQGQIMELSDRLRLIEFSRSAQAFQERLDRHLADAKRHRHLASQQKAEDPGQAAVRELQAQESLLLANVVRPYVEYLPNIIAPDMSVDERRIGLVAVGSLQRRGIEASWVEMRPNQSERSAGKGEGDPRIEYKEKQRSEVFDDQVIGLALVVVALVFSLVLLTFADLSGHRPILARMFYGSAIVSAAIALASALQTDVSLGPILGGVTAAFLLFTIVAYFLGWLRSADTKDEMLQPQGIDTQGFAGGGVQLTAAADGFQRFLILSIALTAFVSAVIGYWYSAAGLKGDDAAHQGYQQQLDLVKRSERANTTVLATFEGLLDLSERRIRCQSARSQAQLAHDNRIAISQTLSSLNAALHCASLEPASLSPQDKTLMELDEQFGPKADPKFPTRLHLHVAGKAPGGSAEESLALWDGFGELTEFWSAKTTSFLACLTIAAIALYIFGQALSMAQLGVTRAMTTVGVVMTIGTFAWSAITWLRSFPTGEASAVEACAKPTGLDRNIETWAAESWVRVAAHNYAIGSQRLGAAETETEYGDAISALECAVGARPNLVLGHNDLAGAKALSQSAHKGQSYYSLPTKDRLEEIERNARAAVDIHEKLGIPPNSYSLNSHAVALWAIGIRDGDLGRITAALTLVERAVTIVENLEADRLRVSADPAQNLYPWLSTLPILYLNQSLFLMAHDRPEEARAAARKALVLGAHRDWSLAGTMVTATGLLETHCEGLHTPQTCQKIRAEAMAYKRALIEGVWDATPSTAAPNQNVPIAISATATKLTLAARINGFDPQKDRLSVVWSVFNPQWNVQDALTAILPPVAASELKVVPASGVTYQRSILQDTAYRRCLQPGDYSATVLLNGAPVGVGKVRLNGPPVTAARLDRMNLALCHPSSWKYWKPAAKGTVPDEMVGFVDKKNRPAAFLFTFAGQTPAQGEVPQNNDYALERALRMLAAGGVVSGAPNELKARLQNCDKTSKGGIAHGLARSSNGMVHVALIMADTVQPNSICSMMQTITIMQSIPH